MSLAVSPHVSSWYDLVLIVASQDNNVCVSTAVKDPVIERYTEFARPV